MAAKSKKDRTSKFRGKWIGPVTVLALVLAVVAVLRWWEEGKEKDEPGILRNLTTVVGNKAPSFSLDDSEGKTYTIAPGDGRNHVLIFHMGSI